MLLHILLWLSSTLVAILPQNATSANIDPSNPSAADPTKPPIKLVPPPRPFQNPWASHIPQLASECTDPAHPNDTCFNALNGQAQGVEAQGGYLVHDGTCGDTEKGQLETAAWDASTLANYARYWPTNARDISAGRFYIGPDYSTQERRIRDNLVRAADFKLKGSSIIVSCKDRKHWCNVKKDGKSIGGYAWTYKGWFRSYHFITLCKPFFSLDSLDTRLEKIEEDLSKGETKQASDARYLKTIGQFFLHEMMHTDMVGKPHIKDEYVSQDGTGPMAYGPFYVYKLAQRSLNWGGGATRASTNADSYAWLANALYWWDTTGYFPGVPNPTLNSRDAVADQSPILIDLGDVSNVQDSAFHDMFNKVLDGFGDEKPELSQPYSCAGSRSRTLQVAFKHRQLYIAFLRAQCMLWSAFSRSAAAICQGRL